MGYLNFEFPFGSFESVGGRSILAQDWLKRRQVHHLFHFQDAMDVHKITQMWIFPQRFQLDYHVG